MPADPEEPGYPRPPAAQPARPEPGVTNPTPSDAERAASIQRLQDAVGDGQLTLGEFIDRLDVAMAASGTSELAVATSGLSAPIVGARNLAVPDDFSVFGDIRVTGRWRLHHRHRSRTVFGDVRIDLREAVCTDSEVVLEVASVFGDVVVTVPEGVDAELVGSTVFGDRVIRLAAVPRVPDTPYVRVRGRTIFGDLRLGSARPGEPTSRWRSAVAEFLRPMLATPPPLPGDPRPPLGPPPPR